MTMGYVLYGKAGTLVLDIKTGQLSMGLKAEGGELKEVALDPAKVVSWRVRIPLCTRSTCTLVTNDRRLCTVRHTGVMHACSTLQGIIKGHHTDASRWRRSSWQPSGGRRRSG